MTHVLNLGDFSILPKKESDGPTRTGYEVLKCPYNRSLFTSEYGIVGPVVQGAGVLVNDGASPARAKSAKYTDLLCPTVATCQNTQMSLNASLTRLQFGMHEII